MTDEDRLGRFLRTKLQNAGKQYETIRKEFATGRAEEIAELSQDESGRVKIVCRRYAEKRSVRLDGDGRPTCFESGHTDCEGCVEDIDDGCIETW